MPELPEVEVTRRRLAPELVGRTIQRLHTTAPSYFFLTPPAHLRQRLEGRTVTALVRRGKYLLAQLDDDSSLLLHLGMTGQLFLERAQSARLLTTLERIAPPKDTRRLGRDPHTHLCFEFTDGRERVLFRDVRKFGKVRWLARGASDPRLDKLGSDALELSGEALALAGKRRRIPIKSLLLDQSVVAGIGNIYADEALFFAGIHPSRKSHRLSGAAYEKLAAQVRQVLHRAIETGGSSIDDYVHPDGSDGHYQEERRVYARQAEPCTVCGTQVRRIVIGQRGSHFCPKCQR